MQREQLGLTKREKQGRAGPARGHRTREVQRGLIVAARFVGLPRQRLGLLAVLARGQDCQKHDPEIHGT